MQYIIQLEKERALHRFNALDKEPFTLESFKDLIKLYCSEKKQFTIAEVETENGKKYYYSATHLNKILFRKLGNDFLFRLRALNPVTNTEIYGDINYYKFECLENSSTHIDINLKASMLFENALNNKNVDVAEIYGPMDAELFKSALSKLHAFDNMSTAIAETSEIPELPREPPQIHFSENPQISLVVPPIKQRLSADPPSKSTKGNSLKLTSQISAGDVKKIRLCHKSGNSMYS